MTEYERRGREEKEEVRHREKPQPTRDPLKQAVEPEDNQAGQVEVMLRMQQTYGNRYVQRLSERSRGTTLNNDIIRRIEAQRVFRKPLGYETRSEMESYFDQDFGGDRIHTDTNADKLAKDLGAKAFTLENGIFFHEGVYQPSSEAGGRLLSQVWTVPAIHRGSTEPMIARLVEYNPDVKGGRFTDPEQAKGVLPFTKEGWKSKEIARKLSQLDSAVARSDNVRCVQTSFLVALVQRGPGALRDMIQNYLNRYRVGLRQATTPAPIKRWYQRSLRNLKPILAKIDKKTLTYEDLSTVLTEMYDVYGKGTEGTTAGPEDTMFKREGYTIVSINKKVNQKQAAAQAKKLKKGEFLICGVNASKTGRGAADHRVHLGRHPDGTLYFYDPAPVKGDQMIVLSEDLKEMKHYFINVLSLGVMKTTGMVLTLDAPRTFEIYGKVSPPKTKAGGK